jgi:hypothetical protein
MVGVTDPLPHDFLSHVGRTRYLFYDHPGRHPDAGQDARVEMSKLRKETNLALMAGGRLWHPSTEPALDDFFLLAPRHCSGVAHAAAIGGQAFGSRR